MEAGAVPQKCRRQLTQVDQAKVRVVEGFHSDSRTQMLQPSEHSTCVRYADADGGTHEVGCLTLTWLRMPVDASSPSRGPATSGRRPALRCVWGRTKDMDGQATAARTGRALVPADKNHPILRTTVTWSPVIPGYGAQSPCTRSARNLLLPQRLRLAWTNHVTGAVTWGQDLSRRRRWI